MQYKYENNFLLIHFFINFLKLKLMNKKFYFALALTAGLFASCSSDDLTADAPQQGFEVNDNEAAQIKINVGNPSKFTRGTGSVQGTTWGGQDFNLFMFKKGTFEPATYDVAGTPTNIYYNTVMTTEAGTSIANEVIPGTTDINYQYFPATGRFDFWAYRADDAADVDATSGDPIVRLAKDDGTDAADEAEATQVRIPFTLTGSQDLMYAETKTDQAAEDLVAASTISDKEEAKTYIYSAYAARRGVNPKMTFKHLLSRLQFQVKAATRDVSDAADEKLDPAVDQDAAGNYYFAGFKVTKVEVWSKNKGELIAAYKGAAPATGRIDWDPAQAWVARDANDAWLTDPNLSLVPFELMQRTKTVAPGDKADIIMKQVGLNATAEITPDAGYEYNGSAAAFIPNNLLDAPCYTANTLDPQTGLPSSPKTTFANQRALATPPASVWVAFVNPAKAEPVYTTDASLPLEALTPIIPHWDGYVPASTDLGWELYTTTKTTYTWTECAADAGATAAAEKPTTETAGNLHDKVVVTDALYNQTYYELTAITVDIDGATEYNNSATTPLADGNAAPKPAENTIVYVLATPGDQTSAKTYYIYRRIGATAATPGNAVPTPIGESILVAPADDNGYLVRFTYQRCVVLKSDGSFETRDGEAIINVKVKDGKQFEAGKYYTVTAILYSDGEVKFEEGDLEAETDGSNDLDDNGAGYGLEN